MKILHVCDSLNPAGLGGYESYLHYLSEHLVSRGDVSIVVAQAPQRDSPDFVDFEFYQVQYLPGNYLEARKWEFLALPEKEREKSVDTLFNKNDLELNVQCLEEQLADVIRQFQPDIIHAHSTYVVFNRVLSKLQENGALEDIPLIATIHGRPKPLILPSGEQTTDYKSFATVCPFDLVLAVSNNVAEILEEYLKLAGSQVPVLPLYLGIDLSVFQPKPELEKKWDIAFMGRLERMKAVDLFPEMLSKLKDKYPSLKMLITGEGSYKERILQLLESSDLEHMVEYLGVVETVKVPSLLNHCKVFMYPSREEPFGLSIIEAMACSVPVIATNVFGPTEIITEGKDGLLIDPDDVDALVEAVISLLDDKQLRVEIGTQGRHTVEKRFDINKHIESLISIYEDLL
jgi:glycosyltransferase involved in cell wall biosynthesis